MANESLNVSIGMDASGFVSGAQQALNALNGLQQSVNGITSWILPTLGSVGGIFGAAKALESFKNFSGTDENGFATQAKGAEEYSSALKAANDQVKELAAVVGQALAPGATATLEAFTAIAP